MTTQILRTYNRDLCLGNKINERDRDWIPHTCGNYLSTRITRKETDCIVYRRRTMLFIHRPVTPFTAALHITSPRNVRFRDLMRVTATSKYSGDFRIVGQRNSQSLLILLSFACVFDARRVVSALARFFFPVTILTESFYRTHHWKAL